MHNERICVYTCITGEYDELQPVYQEDGVDYICFTNNKKLRSSQWRIMYIEDNDQLGNVLLARKVKILGHPILDKQYDISIWVDGTVQVRSAVKEFIELYCEMDRYNIACFKHSVRDCVYDEAVACIIGRKENKEKIVPLIEKLNKEKFPEHYGLIESGVLIRRHNNSLVRYTMKMWLEMLIQYVTRDQLSLPYCIKEKGLNVKWIEMNIYDNSYFCVKSHRKTKDIKDCRIVFGEGKSVFSCVYIDCELEISENGCKIIFSVPIDCENILINLGTHLGKILCDFNMSGAEAAEVTYSGVGILQYHIFDNEDMVIRISGKFYSGQNIECSFNFEQAEGLVDQEYIDAFVNRYYYDKRFLNNMINNMQQQLERMNQKTIKMEEECKLIKKELELYRELGVSPLFNKIRPLCEHQDLLTKILRKIILKRY
ncbi:hypothetical protein IMSAGC020_01610 [Lachnospiraceae bacterium]|nr:hypothetical protein IMSAGC020_01610 [Lachnospiraceae bacterium]